MTPAQSPAQPPVGSRVVLRYRLPAGSVPSQSDVIGILAAVSPQVEVRAADGARTLVEPDDVVVLKSIPPRPVRTGAIRNLEHAAAFAEDAEREWVAGWVARAGLGGLDNSAVPLADPSMPEGGYFHDLVSEATIRELHAWYAQRGLPLQLRLPDRLVRPPEGWRQFGERLVLTAELPPCMSEAPESAAPGDRIQVIAAPDGQLWAGLHLAPASTARLQMRLAGLMADAAAMGAPRAYLESWAPEMEAAARALGFGDHHRVRHVRLEITA